MQVLVVDDHDIFRRGVRSLLAAQEDFIVCGEAVDGQDAVDKARDLRADLVVMDVSMPRLNGLEATRQLLGLLPTCEVLILSQHESPEMARQALKAGARGYVVKSSVSEELIAALTKLSRKEYFFDPAILEQGSTTHVDLQEILQRSATFEQALKQSEKLYRTTFELAAVGVAHVSPDGRWLRVNQRVCDILGYSKAELLRLKFQDITHPDDLTADLIQAEKVRLGSIPTYSLEKRYIRKDGSPVWVNLTVSGVHHESRGFEHFISVIEDITTRKNIAEELADGKRQLLFALQSSKSAMFDWDQAQRRSTWSSEMKAIYDFEPRERYITAEEWRLLFHPDDRERLADEAKKLWKNKNQFDFSFEFRTIPRNGQPKWINSYGRIIRDSAGNVVRMIGIHSDISERKNSQDASGLLAAIVASSDDAIVSKTPSGIITSWNSGAEKLFGYAASEAVGRHITLIVPADRYSEEEDILCRINRGEKIDHFETVRQRKDSGLVDVSVTISPVKNPEGKIVGASKVARDISAKKQSERELATGARQQRALFHLADELHRATSLEEIYNGALNAILNALQCNRASILLADDAGVMRFRSWRGLSNEYRAAVDGHSAWEPGEKNPQLVCIDDVRFVDLSEPIKAAVEKEGIGALAFIPLLSRAHLIGKFMVYFNHAHHFTEDEIDLSLTISRQLSFAIERKRNDEALQRSEEQFRRLSESLDAAVSIQTQQVRSLTHDLLRAQDEERRHIARELHDSSGQTLAVLGMSVAQLSQEAATVAPSLVTKLEEIEKSVQQLHREIRTTSYLLHPPLLDESGLPSALNWYVQGLAERSDITIKLDIPEDFDRLPSDLELAVFRFVQECLANVHRHSGSRSADIHFSLNDDGLRVQVADQGKGIGPERLAEIQAGHTGVGIRGMQERFCQLGGSVKIESDGHGTALIAVVPIPQRVRPVAVPSSQAIA